MTASPNVSLQKLVELIEADLGPTAIVSDPETMEGYSRDWSSKPAHLPELVVRPSSTEEVSRLLSLCAEHGWPVATQGGRTGMSGGAVPQSGEVILSLERMNRIEPPDPATMTMAVEAGATLQAVQEAAEAAGLQFPLDLGSRGSCTIGGAAATNAGGNRVIRYGMMADMVRDIEAVLADGSVIGGLRTTIKDNAGYHLRPLIVGSEGTLAVITRLVLKLWPKVLGSTVMLCAARDLAAVQQLLSHIQTRGPGLISAFEVMWDDYFETALACGEGQRRPFAERYPIYALVEFQGDDVDNLRMQAESILMAALEGGIIEDVVISQSLSDERDLWAIREAISDILAEFKPFIAFDIGLPISRMKSFLAEMHAMLDQEFPLARVLTFGHLGDGNLHLTIGYPDESMLHTIEDKVLAIAGGMQGSVSGEHGIGTIKKDFLRYSRNEAELAIMRGIKRVMDPQGLLNRGRIFDL